MMKYGTYRVQKRGAKHTGIALPTLWARNNGIKLGDEMDIFQDDNGDLLIKKADKNENE